MRALRAGAAGEDLGHGPVQGAGGGPGLLPQFGSGQRGVARAGAAAGRAPDRGGGPVRARLPPVLRGDGREASLWGE
eukprot:3332480-Pyramimonas_sp.AAC.1